MRTPTEQKLAPPASGDRLLSASEVNAKIGSRCKTAHVALALAKKGLIRAVHLNSRVIRFSELSVNELIAGKAA